MKLKIKTGMHTCTHTQKTKTEKKVNKKYIEIKLLLWDDTFSDQPEVLKDRMPRSLIWALGFMERLDCPVDANPPVTQIVWTKNGMIINFDDGPLHQLENGSLLVEQVTQEDSGNYRCTAISSYGNGDSEIVQVEVKGEKLLYLPVDSLSFSTKKVSIFFLFLHKANIMGTHIEVPHQGTSI